MYDGPQSPALVLLHGAMQQPLAAACVGLAVGAFVLVTPSTELPVALPNEVPVGTQALYDGAADSYIDIDKYDFIKGDVLKQCNTVVYEDGAGNGVCVCEERKPNKVKL